MKKYYFIDFENVNDAGLDGFFALSKDDVVFLLYSENAGRISIEFLKQITKKKFEATIEFIKVHPGNQALDMQLASFLGGMVAASEDNDFFAIISKDKGYDCLPKFWKDRGSKAIIVIAPSIAEAGSTQSQGTTFEKDTSKKNSSATKKEDLIKIKNRLNSSVMRTLIDAGYDNITVGRVASLVTKSFNGKINLQTIHRKMVDNFGQKKGLRIYQKIQSVLI